MPLIIDTYNLLHVTGILPPEIAGIDLPGLIRLLQQSRYRHERVDLVCDGSPRADVPPGRVGGVHIRYAGPGKEADGLINRMIRESSSPRRLTVVSSDHAVQRAARVRKCRVLSSQDLMRQLALDAERPAPKPDPPSAAEVPVGGLPDPEVDQWIAEFDVDLERLERETRAAPRPFTARDARPGAPETDRSGSDRRAAQGEKNVQRGPGHESGHGSGQGSGQGATLPEDVIAEAERLAREAQPPASPEDEVGQERDEP